MVHSSGKLWLTGLALLFLVGCQSPAKPLRGEQLARELHALAEAFSVNRDFSGIIAVAQGGELLGQAAVGFADAQGARPHDLHTTFHVASITKTFTAAAIRNLINENRLSLQDPLSNFAPGFPRGDEITIAHLLDHQSGVPDYWLLSDVGDYASRRISLQELVRWLGSQPLDFDPGTRDSYSNSGYALLAAVIEAVSEKSFHGYLAEHVFPPAGLTETGGFHNDADAAGFTPAYAASGIAPNEPYEPSILIGAGSLKSSASDLLAWCEAFNADFRNSETAVFLSGWGVRREGGHRWAEQTGRNPGFSAHLRAYPDSDSCVVVLSNIESESVGAIGALAAGLVFGEKTRLPAKRTPVSLPDDEQAAYAGRFEVSPGQSVEVIKSAEGLLLKGTNGPLLPLEPIGPDRFFYRQLYVVIEGKRNSAGEVTSLLWGGSWEMPRVR